MEIGYYIGRGLSVNRPNSINEPVMRVHHSSLSRSEDSAFISECPKCNEGLLLVQREKSTLTLMREDRCIMCGQQFFYLDFSINGEELPVMM